MSKHRLEDVLEEYDLIQRVFHPLPDSDEAGQVQLVDVMPRMCPVPNVQGQIGELRGEHAAAVFNQDFEKASDLGKKIEDLSHGLASKPTCDYAIPQMARVSYGVGTKKVSEDTGLIRYLKRLDHDSPFEGIIFKFRIRCPIMVYRQMFRHRTTDQCEVEIISTDENARKYMSMNEYSGRYSVIPDIFYVPKNLRIQSKTNKQGGDELLDQVANDTSHQVMVDALSKQYEDYQALLRYGVSRELAREILGVGYVTEFYMIVNLLNVFRWLLLRLDRHAQLEIRVFAEHIASIVRTLCPTAYKAFESYMLFSTKFSFEEMIVLRDILQESSDVDIWIPELGEVVPKDIRDIAWQHLSKREKEEFLEKFKGPRGYKAQDLSQLRSSLITETTEAKP